MDTIPKREPVIEELKQEWYRPFVSKVSMLLLDVIHPVVSGNKWYKLKLNIEYALEHGYKTVLSFGGPYSNHLVATAATAQQFGLNSIGIVRGLHAKAMLTPTLDACKEYGMQLVFVTKDNYARKEEATYLQELSDEYGQPFIIPEGGKNEWGREGCEAIENYIPESYTHVCVSIGTGTTFVGLRNALPEHIHVYGYVPMKNGVYLSELVQQHIHPEKNINWQLFDQWHFGGFGKWNDELIQFMNEFYELNKIPLDIVYTAKMMAGVQQQIREHYFSEDANVLCIHTGGLQGNASVRQHLAY